MEKSTAFGESSCFSGAYWLAQFSLLGRRLGCWRFIRRHARHKGGCQHGGIQRLGKGGGSIFSQHNKIRSS